MQRTINQIQMLNIFGVYLNTVLNVANLVFTQENQIRNNGKRWQYERWYDNIVSLLTVVKTGIDQQNIRERLDRTDQLSKQTDLLPGVPAQMESDEKHNCD